MKLKLTTLAVAALCGGLVRPRASMSVRAYVLAGGPQRHIRPPSPGKVTEAA